MKKRRYKLYEECFKSCIDNEYHTEIYYTKNKKLKDKSDLYFKSTGRVEIYTLLTFLGLFLGLLLSSIGIYTFDNDPSIVPGIILCSLGGLNVILMIISNCLRIKHTINSIKTSDWKDIFKQSNEYKQQAEKYKKQYEDNALNKKSLKAKKLIDIYDNLDNKKISREEKILNIAKILDIKDVD